MPRGRPKEENTRDVLLRVRLTADEYQKLKGLSLKTGKSMSELVRAALVSLIASADGKK